MSSFTRSLLSPSTFGQTFLKALRSYPHSSNVANKTAVALRNGQHSFFHATPAIQFFSTEVVSNETVDFFKLFGYPRKFGIPQPELKGIYLKLMTEHHPDKQQQSSPSLDKDVTITAETITHAYQTLQAPHTRASHWLELHSIGIEDGAEAPNLGMEFLMEIMEWRERIEELSHMEDSQQRQELLKEIASETTQLQSECESSLGKLLDVENLDLEDETILQRARQLTAQLQYWHRLEETLKDAMDVE